MPVVDLIDASYKLLMTLTLIGGAIVFLWQIASFLTSAKQSLKAIPELVQGQKATTDSINAINVTLEKHIHNTESQIETIQQEIYVLKQKNYINSA